MVKNSTLCQPSSARASPTNRGENVTREGEPGVGVAYIISMPGTDKEVSTTNEQDGASGGENQTRSLARQTRTKKDHPFP